MYTSINSIARTIETITCNYFHFHILVRIRLRANSSRHCVAQPIALLYREPTTGKEYFMVLGPKSIFIAWATLCRELSASKRDQRNLRVWYLYNYNHSLGCFFKQQHNFTKLILWSRHVTRSWYYAKILWVWVCKRWLAINSTDADQAGL